MNEIVIIPSKFKEITDMTILKSGDCNQQMSGQVFTVRTFALRALSNFVHYRGNELLSYCLIAIHEKKLSMSASSG